MQDIKSRTETNAPALRAILMAMRIRRYGVESITQYGRSRATQDATGRRHWAIISPISPGRHHGYQFWHKTSSCGAVKSFFEVGVKMARNGPSTQLIEATSCVESLNAKI